MFGSMMCVMINVDKVIEDFNEQIEKSYGSAEKKFKENFRDAIVAFLFECGTLFDKETGEILS